VPGFRGNVQDIMNRVARYYATRGIFIVWHFHQYEEKGRSAVSAGNFAMSGNTGAVPQMQSEEEKTNCKINRRITRLHFGESPTGKDEDRPVDQDQVAFYNDNFSKVPTLFFVDNISLEGGDDQPGVTPGPFNHLFAFIRSSGLGWWPEYDRVAAHELAHILGVGYHTNAGLMLSQGGGDPLAWAFGVDENPHLDDSFGLKKRSPSYLGKTEEDLIRKSRWLTPMADPVPK
jgi:hypothetical protein